MQVGECGQGEHRGEADHVELLPVAIVTVHLAILFVGCLKTFLLDG